jgi:isochorismate synthase
VLSRKETIPVPNFDLIATFQKIIQLYPSTFVYCFIIQKLIMVRRHTRTIVAGVFETISLAGTQKR